MARTVRGGNDTPDGDCRGWLCPGFVRAVHRAEARAEARRALAEALAEAAEAAEAA